MYRDTILVQFMILWNVAMAQHFLSPNRLIKLNLRQTHSLQIENEKRVRQARREEEKAPRIIPHASPGDLMKRIGQQRIGPLVRAYEYESLFSGTYRFATITQPGRAPFWPLSEFEWHLVTHTLIPFGKPEYFTLERCAHDSAQGYKPDFLTAVRIKSNEKGIEIGVGSQVDNPDDALRLEIVTSKDYSYHGFGYHGLKFLKVHKTQFYLTVSAGTNDILLKWGFQQATAFNIDLVETLLLRGESQQMPGLSRSEASGSSGSSPVLGRQNSGSLRKSGHIVDEKFPAPPDTGSTADMSEDWMHQNSGESAQMPGLSRSQTSESSGSSPVSEHIVDDPTKNDEERARKQYRWSKKTPVKLERSNGVLS